MSSSQGRLKDFLGTQQLGFSCSKCGYQLRETITRLKTSPNLVCPGCGITIQVDASQFTRKITEMNKAIHNFTKKLSQALQVT